jgi:hypothetical protein
MNDDPEEIVRLRISLDGIEPEIWRRAEVPSALTLKAVHDVIQAVMAWEDYHLFEFRIDEKRYGIPDPDWDIGLETANAKNIKLKAVVDRGIDTFFYTYDFGDSWDHIIEIEDVFDAEPNLSYPRFIDGERRAPPEDVGGIPGFFDFLDVMEKGKGPRYREVVEWYGKPFDPNEFDLLPIRLRLGTIIKRRRAGKASYQKRTQKN